jgi:hypothetical protein
LWLTTGRCERVIVDGTTNLQLKIGPAWRPSHLLRFIHSPVDETVRRRFGDCRSDTQSATVAFGIIDQPVILASEVTIQSLQGGPQLS